MKIRILEQVIRNLFKSYNCVYINGARQIGKSTLVQKIAKENNFDYLSFDNINYRNIAKEKPEDFIKNITNSVVIDEVQMVPEIFLPLKIKIDEIKSKNLKQQILLTGSANLMALPQLSDALVGRMLVFTLNSFCESEFLEKENNFINKIFNENFSLQTNINKANISLIEAIQTATFPEISIKNDKHQWLNSYVDTLISRDIKNLTEITKSNEIFKLLNIIATQVGGLVNESVLARQTGLNNTTLNRYKNLLINVFLITEVYSYQINLKKRLVKSSKLYMNDTNLLLFLLHLNIENAKNSYLYGRIIENFVFCELQKLLTIYNTIKLYHFRTSDNKEIDFILEKNNGDFVAIEVKSGTTVKSEDFKHLQFLKSETGNKFVKGIVLYDGDDIIPFEDKLCAMPISSLWNS